MTKSEVLKSVFGHSSFRKGQEEVIDALLQGRDVLGIMPTGAGKSICYQLPCLMKHGITLVVSPLISLMKDQVMALKSCGVAAAYINSSLTAAQQTEALRRAALGAYKIIYVAPERLETQQFLYFATHAEISLLAVDEAHCISQWGQDFRPSYLRINSFVQELPTRPPIAAFTATATARVREDIIRYLELNHPYLSMASYNRDNLIFKNVKPSNKYVYLSRFLKEHQEDCGIIYCNTRKTVEEVCGKLKLDGYLAERYHAGLSDAERIANQDDFRFDRIRIMVATNAFGMGIDKPDVRYVVHYNMPRSMEAYYQEAGRAGRDGLEADCILLYSGQDIITARWMIDQTEPSPEFTKEEAEMVRKQELDRLQKMTFYATSKRCLRHEILKYFGEYGFANGCGRCSVCRHEPFEVDCGNSKSFDAHQPSFLDDSAPQKRRQSEDRSYWEEEKNRDDWVIGECREQSENSENQEIREGAENRASRASGKTASGMNYREEALYENLKVLRKLIATSEKVPAFMILSNASLQDMISKMPKTQEDFLKLSGVGDIKCARYGKVFLEVLRDGKEPNEAFLDYVPLR